MSDLRERLERESERMVRPTGFADRMFERGRRRERNRRVAALGVGAVLFIVVLVIVRSALPDADREPRPATPTLTAASVAGSYTVHLPIGDTDVRRLRMNGTFEMRLSDTGSISLSGPRRFDLPGDPISFEIAGDELTTDFFVGAKCTTNATYRWTREGESLTLDPIDDPCERRSVLLTSRPWTTDATASPLPDPLEGDWTATFSCEQMVRTVRRAPIAPQDEAFWARGVGKERGADDPADPCSGAPEPLSFTFRFGGGRLLIFDADLREGFDGSYELRGDTFILRDGSYQNIIGSYRVAFRIEGDRVSFDLLGRGSTDSFFVATWESAAFVRQP